MAAGDSGVGEVADALRSLYVQGPDDATVREHLRLIAAAVDAPAPSGSGVIDLEARRRVGRTVFSAAALGAAILGGGLAAAGELPPAVQERVASLVAPIGIRLPHNRTNGSDFPPSTNPVGPTAGPGQPGQGQPGQGGAASNPQDPTASVPDKDAGGGGSPPANADDPDRPSTTKAANPEPFADGDGGDAADKGANDGDKPPKVDGSTTTTSAPPPDSVTPPTKKPPVEGEAQTSGGGQAQE